MAFRRKGIDLESERTQEARRLLFPQRALERTLGPIQTYDFIRKEEKRERFKAHIKNYSKKAGLVSLFSAMGLAGLLYGIQSSGFHYEKGHVPSAQEPYSYTKDAPFNLRAIYLDGIELDNNLLYLSPTPVGGVPLFLEGQVSELTLYFDGEINDSCVQLFLGGLFGSRLIEKKCFKEVKKDSLNFAFSWPIPSVDFYLGLAITNQQKTYPDNLFFRAYYNVGIRDVSLEEQLELQKVE